MRQRETDSSPTYRRLESSRNRKNKNSKDSNLDILICTLLGLFQGLVGDIDSVFFNNDMADEFDKAYETAKDKGGTDA